MHLSYTEIQMLSRLSDGEPVDIIRDCRSDLAIVEQLLERGYIERIVNTNPAVTSNEMLITQEGTRALRLAFARAAAVGLRLDRPAVDQKYIDLAAQHVIGQYARRIKDKGDGGFVSRHEIIGIIDEEMNELKASVHANQSEAHVIAELADIAVPAIFGIASIYAGVTKC